MSPILEQKRAVDAADVDAAVEAAPQPAILAVLQAGDCIA